MLIPSTPVNFVPLLRAKSSTTLLTIVTPLALLSILIASSAPCVSPGSGGEIDRPATVTSSAPTIICDLAVVSLGPLRLRSVSPFVSICSGPLLYVPGSTRIVAPDPGVLALLSPAFCRFSPASASAIVWNPSRSSRFLLTRVPSVSR